MHASPVEEYFIATERLQWGKTYTVVLDYLYSETGTIFLQFNPG